jgi:hypothetical protein
MNTELKSQSIKDFCISKSFVQISKTVRQNSNGYPFITFIYSNNNAENIYFSKNAASKVAEGEIVTKELISKLAVVEATNAEGEIRFKLSFGDSQRINIMELLG